MEPQQQQHHHRQSCDDDDGGSPPPPPQRFTRNRSFKSKQLVRSQAIKESQSPPRIPSPRSFEIYDATAVSPSFPLLKTKSASVDNDYNNVTCDDVRSSFKTPDRETSGAMTNKSENVVTHEFHPQDDPIIRASSNYVKDGHDDSTEDKSPNNTIEGQTEANQIEIQVTTTDKRKFCLCKNNNYLSANASKGSCDYGIGPSIELDEDEECTDTRPKSTNGGRRAMCASKQDSGVCCWELCNCCGDISPEITYSDTEEDNHKCKITRNDYDFDNNGESFGPTTMTTEKCEKWSRRNASSLSVRSASGGNPRLLRKQSSGTGSMDSGHSFISPHLSRDGSTEIIASWDGDVSTFIKETLNKGPKDRQTLLKLEEDMIAFIKDPYNRELRFPATSSYGRLLVHRCADLFGFRHMLDPVTRHIVLVAKLSQVNYRVPSICPFIQWCTGHFTNNPMDYYSAPNQTKSILKRDTQSLDEEPLITVSGPPKLMQTSKSKSFEQREEEYVKARRRIFSTSEQQSEDWPYDEMEEGEEGYKVKRIMVENKLGRLLKVHSMENSSAKSNVRGVVLKAHSFGGYAGRLGVQRGDSISSSISAPPHRILSRQGELASNWKLSPSSSGYKTMSGRSDSITPSPTSTPHTVCTKKSHCPEEEDDEKDAYDKNVSGSIMWAITDMSTVPIGAIIIHPQTGQALTNSDGTLYHYDPTKILHSALMPSTQSDGVKVLSNPERRRSRLEKQRATLSPSVDTQSGNQKIASVIGNPEDRAFEYNEEENKNSDDSTSPEINPVPKIQENVNFNKTNVILESPRIESAINEKLEDNYKKEHCGETPLSYKEYEFCEYEKSDATETKVFDQNFSKNFHSAFPPSNPYEHHHQYYENDAHITSPQYVMPYDENTQELYSTDPHQYIGYAPRSNEAVVPAPTMPTQYVQPPHMFTTAPPDTNMGYSPNVGLCYTTPTSAHMLIQAQNYRMNEQENQHPFHIIPTTEQQPVFVTLTNKLPEHDIANQHQVSGYPINFHQQLERTSIIPPPTALVGVAPPPPNTVGYQFPAPSAWGWSQMGFYPPQLPHMTTLEDINQKYSMQHNDVSAAVLHHTAESSLSQQVYPHSNMLHVHPSQLYSSYNSQQAQQLHYPIYQPQYNHGRNSVLSQDECGTPGLCDIGKNFDMECRVNNAKSPKTPVTSRAASNSGSSRTTPSLINSNMQPIQTQNVVPEVHCLSADSNYYPNCQYMHPALNYIPCHYPINIAPMNCYQDNCQSIPKTSGIQYNKNKSSWKDGGKQNVFKNPINNKPPPFLPNKKADSIEQSHDIIAQKPFDNSLEQNINNPNFSNYKVKDKRKSFKYGSSGDDSFEGKKFEHNNNNNTIIKYMQPPSNEQHVIKTPLIKDEPKEFNRHNSIEGEQKSFVSKQHQSASVEFKNHTAQWVSSTEESVTVHTRTATINRPQPNTTAAERKENWRKLQNQKENVFHNFPKNLNKQNPRRSSFGEKQYSKYVPKESSNEQKPQVDHIQRMQSFTKTDHSNPANNAGLLPLPSSMHNPLKPDMFAAGSTRNINRLNSIDTACLSAVAAQQRILDGSILGMPLPHNTQSYYQNAQALHNIGMLQTPPVQGQSAFLFRQAPGWARRLPTQTLYGAAAAFPQGQIRQQRPPRQNQQRYTAAAGYR